MSQQPTPEASLRSKTYYLREWAILGLFSCLTLIMLYPLSLNLTRMVPEPTDPLLNAWRMQWLGQAALQGPSSLANIFDTNIFYPFPLTLAYSEHFIMIAAQALPFLLLPDSHLFGMNLSVLLTFVLSAYGMYLLVTAWTENRWAGLVAGVLFAFSPHRFGQLNHLELLVTQWLPLALLALHWTLTRSGWRYPLLFAVFFNLQALSGFHYTLNLTIACLLLVLTYALTKRIRWRANLWLAGLATVIATILLNFPIWRAYLQFSDSMAAIRTPGEVRVYSAAFSDYLTALPYSLLYGWTFGYWPAIDRQIQPLMPAGITGLLLGLVAIFWLFKRSKRGFAKPTVIFGLILVPVAMLLSFGLNENALGLSLAPLLQNSPYAWLYDNIFIFQGIRVPGRYGILVVVGVAILAGWGVSGLTNKNDAWSGSNSSTKLRTGLQSLISIPLIYLALIALILLESWAAPLVGPEFPTGSDIPRVYSWLQQNSSDDAVVLELPFKEGASEFLYEYFATHHWRRLANGGTGFTPPIYDDMRHWFKVFPDPRSVDVARQLGVDLIVLHPELYPPEEWQRLLNDLPRYLPAFKQIRQLDQMLVLELAEPACRAEAQQITASVGPAELDGLPNGVAINYFNHGSATFVADVQQVSQLQFSSGDSKNFTEPLLTPPGETQMVVVPLQAGQSLDQLSGATLRSLERVVSGTELRGLKTLPLFDIDPAAVRPLGLSFADGPRLAGFILPESPTPCSALNVALAWEGGQAGDQVEVQLLDPFGRTVVNSLSSAWLNPAPDGLDRHVLPLLESIPPGRYGLRVYVQAADGQERFPITEAGVTIPTNQIPPLPVVIHPQSTAAPSSENSLERFDSGIHLVAVSLGQTQLTSGDWLQVNLTWRAEVALDAEFTVFTQLLGPDGQVWGQRDNQPGGGWYGTTLWQPGQLVSDYYAFQIPVGAPPGSYRLIAGLYNSESLVRVSSQAGQDFVEIGQITLK